MHSLTDNFKALASQRRLIVLRTLNGADKDVTEVAKLLGVKHNTASYHLRKLQREGYIQSVRRGRHTYYTLAPQLAASKLYAQIQKN